MDVVQHLVDHHVDSLTALIAAESFFAALIEKNTLARVTRTLGTLVSSGVPILEALNITKDTAGNALSKRDPDAALAGARAPVDVRVVEPERSATRSASASSGRGARSIARSRRTSMHARRRSIPRYGPRCARSTRGSWSATTMLER